MPIKALEWDKRDGPYGGWFADADIGLYRVYSPNFSGVWKWTHYSCWPGSGSILNDSGYLLCESFATPEDAMRDVDRDRLSRAMSILPTRFSAVDAANLLLDDLNKKTDPEVAWQYVWDAMREDVNAGDIPAAMHEALTAIAEEELCAPDNKALAS